MNQVGRLVQTNTPLPPGIRGRIMAHLNLQVSLFRWTGVHPLRGTKIENLQTAMASVSVRVVWWGEEGPGIVFRPRIAHRTGQKQANAMTTARYSVCVPVHKLNAYLSGKSFRESIIKRR